MIQMEARSEDSVLVSLEILKRILKWAQDMAVDPEEEVFVVQRRSLVSLFEVKVAREAFLYSPEV